MARVKDRGGGWKERLALVLFLAAKTENPVLLRNQTETLARRLAIL